MISLFEISVNMLEMFVVLMFLTLYFGSKYNRVKAVGGFLLGWIVTVGVITYLNTLFIYEAFLGLIFAGLYFLYCILFLKGDIITKLFISGFINCVVYSIALVSALLVSVLFDGDTTQIYSMTTKRVYLIVISKTLLIIVCAIMLRFRFDYVVKKYNIFLFIAVSLLTEMSTVGIMSVFMRHSELSNELLLAAVSVLFTNFFIYYVFIKNNRDIEKDASLSLLKQKIEIDKKNAGDIESLYIKTCGIYHDLIIHFSTISKLLDESTEKARGYINTIMNNQLCSIKTLIRTGNDCFDAIVNTKIALCEKYNIKCVVRVMENSLDKMPHDEVAILFGNLFDNAIEATKKSGKKIIKLDVQIQDVYVSVFMKNSIDTSVLANNKELRTTKRDKEYHGFGIKNIKRIVDKHNGIIYFKEENGYFICDILLPR